jgi:hypothetical protein
MTENPVGGDEVPAVVGEEGSSGGDGANGVSKPAVLIVGGLGTYSFCFILPAIRR